MTADSTTMTDRNREAHVRRLAARKGLMLVKSRHRDPRHEDYGLYVLVNETVGNRIGRRGGQAAVSGFLNGYGGTLADMERELA